jgi:hypothetical protein
VFGELTNYPGAGREPFKSEALELAVASHWSVPRRHR